MSPVEEWNARRLGGSSTGLPDVVAVNNHNGILFAIEAKSTTSDWVKVPYDEYIRCQQVCNIFKLYENSYILLAFKFGSDKKNKDKIYKLGRGKTGTKKKRTNKDIKEYYFVIKHTVNIEAIEYVRCNYKGELYVKKKPVDPVQQIVLGDPQINYIMFDNIEKVKQEVKRGFIYSKLKYA